jgi:gluconolactonase
LSPDEKKLYVIDTGFTDGPDNPSHIRAFNLDVGAGRHRTAKSLRKCPSPALPTGRCDTEGVLVLRRLGRSERGRRALLHSEGDLLGKIHIPETVANLCFGGQQRNRLYICGSTSLYSLHECAGRYEA